MVQKLYISIEWLTLRYVRQNKSIDEMSKEANVAPMTIRRALEKAGLIRR